MGSSVQPISAAAMSALVQELDPDSAALFGDPFDTTVTPTPSVATGKIARVLDMLRRKTVPLVLQSMSTSKITVVVRSRVTDPDDPLNSRMSVGESDVYAAVSGPTAESLKRSWTVMPAYEVLIAANNLDAPLGDNDAIKLDGVSYDIVGIQAHPHTPPAVAYRYWLARVAA